jgi:putative transposase
MTRKRFSEEDILNILRQVELDLATGSTVEAAIRTAGISDATYYKCRKMYGGMGKLKLHEFKEMEKENSQLKRIVAELDWTS